MLTALTNIDQRPLVEDDLWWKTTSVGRWPLVEDNLRGKTTFGGRRPSVENDLQWKTTFGGRWPSVEDNNSVKDELWWKTTLVEGTFGKRWPTVEDDLQKTLHAAYSALRHVSVKVWIKWLNFFIQFFKNLFKKNCYPPFMVLQSGNLHLHHKFISPANYLSLVSYLNTLHPPSIIRRPEKSG